MKYKIAGFNEKTNGFACVVPVKTYNNMSIGLTISVSIISNKPTFTSLVLVG